MAEPQGPGGPPGKRLGRQPPWEKSGEPETGSFGTWLRRQRELREISLRDVAERTKISLRYLEAMEADRFDLLPAPVFAKGFLREYARYVGLSPDEVVNHWLAVQQAGERPEGEVTAAQTGSPRGKLSRAVLVLALLLLAALIAFGIYWQRHRSKAGAPVASTPAAPSPEASAPGSAPAAAARPGGRPVAAPALPPPVPPAETPSEAPPAPLEVTLDFSRECWVEALIDGRKRIAEQRVAGEALRLPAQQRVQLTLGDAGAAEVQVNGSPLALPVNGKGQVLRDFTIDLETLKSLKAKKETR